MLTLIVAVVALLVVGLLAWWPASAATEGVVPLVPGLLSVDPAARGEFTLGQGLTISMSSAGVRVASGTWPFLDTVTRGSFLTALSGSATGGREHVTARRRNVVIEHRSVTHATVRWDGWVTDDSGGARLPLVVEASRVGEGVRVRFAVPGADGLALHFDYRSNTRGVPPSLPDRNLRLRAWWVTGTVTPLFTTVAHATMGLAAGASPRAVDMRVDGILSVHAWADDVTLTVDPIPAFAADWHDG